MEKANANNKKLENALDYSIKLLNSGASIEDCLKLYPNQRKELKGLLEAATTLKSAYPGYPELRPSKLYAKTARAEFLAAIEHGVPATPRVKTRDTGVEKERRFVVSTFYKRFALVSTAAAAALAMAIGGLIFAADDSIPGSPLYGVKRAKESVQLALTFGEENRAKLHYDLAQKRIAEAKRMAKAGKQAEVADISREARENLDEANKVAKAVPPVDKEKIAREIDSLNGTAGDKLAKTTNPGSDAATSAAADEAPLSGKDKGSSAEDQSTTSTAVSAAGKRLAERAAGAASTSKSLASLAPFEIAGISASGRSISPNGDGVKDSISVSVSGASSNKFKVELHRGGLPVAVIAEQSGASDIEFTWDGRDIDGNVIPDGEYAVKVANSAGQTAHNKVRVTVDTAAPSIKLVEPPANVETDVSRPRFVWQASEDVESCALYLSSEGLTREILGITDGFYLMDKDLQPGAWKWSVVVKDKAGNVARSEMRALSIIESATGGDKQD